METEKKEKLQGNQRGGSSHQEHYLSKNNQKICGGGI